MLRLLFFTKFSLFSRCTCSLNRNTKNRKTTFIFETYYTEVAWENKFWFFCSIFFFFNPSSLFTFQCTSRLNNYASSYLICFFLVFNLDWYKTFLSTLRFTIWKIHSVYHILKWNLDSLHKFIKPILLEKELFLLLFW